MILGDMVFKHKKCLCDVEKIESIKENPYYISVEGERTTSH